MINGLSCFAPLVPCIIFTEYNVIEHTENRMIAQSGMFENEIGPGVLQTNMQQRRVLQDFKRHKSCSTDYVSFLPPFYKLFADCMVAEHWTRHSSPTSFSKHVIILFLECSVRSIDRKF